MSGEVRISGTLIESLNKAIDAVKASKLLAGIEVLIVAVGDHLDAKSSEIKIKNRLLLHEIASLEDIEVNSLEREIKILELKRRAKRLKVPYSKGKRGWKGPETRTTELRAPIKELVEVRQ